MFEAIDRSFRKSGENRRHHLVLRQPHRAIGSWPTSETCPHFPSGETRL